MKKQVFYLKDEPEFFETIESEFITWTYRYEGKVMYSVALRDLVEREYFLN